MAENERGIIVLGFSEEYKWNPQTQKRDKLVEYVRYAPRTAAHTTEIKARVAELMPKNNDDAPDGDYRKDMQRDFVNMRWSWIEPAYRAWKEGREIPINGTPLAAWGALSEPHIKAFQSNGIKTVEDVRDMPEAVISRLPLPGVRSLVAQAKAFLENSDKSALAEALAKKDEQIAALIERLTAVEETMKAEPKRRGRPPKAKNDETEAETETEDEAA